MMLKRLSRRMQAMFKWLFPIIGLLLLTCIAGLIFWWETDGRDRYMYQPALILKEEVRRGDIIREDMLDSVRYDKNLLIAESIADPNKVIGMEARHYIPAGTQLHPRYFDQPGLLTREDTFIVKVPNEWLYSVPDTLRRKDRVAFFEVTREVLNQALSEGNAELYRDQDTAANAPNSLNTYRYPDAQASLALSGEPIYLTTVAYVKDGANREVVSVSDEDRLDGSSLIGSIEIPMRPGDKTLLEQAVARGSKFIVAYTEGDT